MSRKSKIDAVKKVEIVETEPQRETQPKRPAKNVLNKRSVQD